MGVLVTIQHCRELQYCTTGLRAFFRRHKLDLREFVRNGFDSDYFLTATNNDGMVVALVELANGRK